jgi:hypothetical protein
LIFFENKVNRARARRKKIDVVFIAQKARNEICDLNARIFLFHDAFVRNEIFESFAFANHM